MRGEYERCPENIDFTQGTHSTADVIVSVVLILLVKCWTDMNTFS